MDKKIIIKKKCPVGVCFVKNDISKITGKKNQKIFKFVFKASIKQNTEITESIEAWWSTYGVPEEGYANTETNKAYRKQ